MSDSIYAIMVIGIAWYTLLLLSALIVIVLVRRRETIEYKSALENVIDELKDIIQEEEIIMSVSLTHLLTYKPYWEDYEEVLDLLTQLAQNRYEEDKWLFARSPDETKEANFLQVISNWSEDPELHKQIFQKAVYSNLNMKELQAKFAERVADGEVIPLGDNAVVITDDNTGNAPTGVSPINSGLEGSEICFIISFIQGDNYAAWHEHNFPAKEEPNE